MLQKICNMKLEMNLGCKDLEKCGPGPGPESKHGLEWGQYVTDFDDFGADEKLKSRATQRHQIHQNWPHISGPNDQFCEKQKRLFCACRSCN